MDINEFLATQWLKEDTGDTGIYNAREGISAHFGWEDSNWYKSVERQTELFEWLNSEETQLLDPSQTRKALLDKLGSISEEAEREPWITTVEREVFWSVPENRYLPPDWSSDYEMNYRYDRLLEVYEWEDPGTAPGIWMSQEQADAQMRAWQQREGAQYEYSAAVWDENLEMLYRTNQEGVYEYAYSDDTVNVRPGTQWLTYEQVMKGAQPEPQAPPVAEAPAVDVPADVTQKQEEVISYMVGAFTVSKLPDDVREALTLLSQDDIQEILEEDLDLV
jgi:hypothetical protein